MLLTDDQVNRISSDGLIHDAQRLKELQNMPLHRKVGITAARIMEWYRHWNGNVYVSFSGGKDSTVLLYLARQLYPDIPAVFSNTGLEYLEIQKFVRGFDNLTMLTPKMRFDQVISTYGYPLISKEVAEAIYYARRIVPNDSLGGGRGTKLRNGNRRNYSDCAWIQGSQIQKEGTYRKQDRLTRERERERERESTREPVDSKTSLGELEKTLPAGRWRRRCLTGVGGHEDFSGKSMFNKKKWLPIAEYLPVAITHRCCDIMKKSPMNIYSRQSKRKPIIGTMATESRMRKQAWIRHGCNAFEGSHISSQPMSFWTEQDVLAYIKQFEIPICSVYGDINIVNQAGEIIVPEGGCMPDGCKFKCSGCDRTGCIFCAFGFHSEKGETRFQRLAKTHPRQYEYCIGGGQWVDNPAYDPTASMKPDEMGWINWNPKQIWVPSKKGLGMGKVFDMCNELLPGLYRYD